MRADSIPQSLREVLRGFESCFTAPTYRRFLTLVIGWLFCRSRHWVTRVVRASGESTEQHHAGFHRFFSEARWEPDEAWQALLNQLLPYLPKRIEVIVDDTLCRRNGPRIFGAGMHHDGAASSQSAMGKQVSFGHSWVVLTLVVPTPWKSPGIAVPVAASLYRSLKTCPKSEYRKRTVIARELVEKLASWLPEGRTVHLMGDREYACKTVLRDLDQAVEFTGPMPMDAMLFKLLSEDYRQKRGTRRVMGDRLPSSKELAANDDVDWVERKVSIYGKTVVLLTKDLVCLWYTATGTRPVRVVVTRDPKGNYADRAFFSTRHKAGAKTLLESYARRWLIEVSFREAKQTFGFSEAQNGWSRGTRPQSRPKPGPQARGKRGRRAVERTAPFALIVRGILVAWYLGQNRWEADVEKHKRHSPWNTKKTHPSLGDMLDAVREEIQLHRIQRHPLRISTRAQLEKARKLLGMAA